MEETATNNTATELAALEEQLWETIRKIAELRKQNPKTISDYTLTGPDGNPVHLSELFGGKRDLIVVHNMGRRCSYCTMWADGLNGVYTHLADRASFVVVSPDSPDVQKEFAAKRGWRFPIYSDQEKTFTNDLGYITQENGSDFWLPGYSTFHLNDDGTITHIASDFFGPGDLYCSPWHIFSLLKDGAGGWQPAL